MRKTILAMLLSGIIPATASAQMDGGSPPDGSYVSPSAVDETGGHTGSSSDPHGNMGNTGRTGKDAGASGTNSGSTNSGSEDSSGTPQGPPPQGEGTPSPYTGGKSAPRP